MPTEDSLISVPFVAGENSDLDAKALPAPGLLVLENGFLDNKGAIRKRPGTVFDRFLPFIKPFEPRWMRRFDGNVVIGTNLGVYSSVSPSASFKNFVPDSNAEAYSDHTVLSSLGGPPRDVRTFVYLNYVITLFVVKTPLANTHDLYYTVHDRNNGALVNAPQILYTPSAGTILRQPALVISATSARVFVLEQGSAAVNKTLRMFASVATNTFLTGLVGGLSVGSSYALTSCYDVVQPHGAAMFGGFCRVTYAGSPSIEHVRFVNAALSAVSTITTTWGAGAVRVACYYNETTDELWAASIGDSNTTLAAGTGTGIMRAAKKPWASAWAGATSAIVDGCVEEPSWTIQQNHGFPDQNLVVGGVNTPTNTPWEVAVGPIDNDGVVDIGVWASTRFSDLCSSSLIPTVASCTSFFTINSTSVTPIRRAPLWNYVLVSRAALLPHKNTSGVLVARSASYLGGNSGNNTIDDLSVATLVCPTRANNWNNVPVGHCYENRVPPPTTYTVTFGQGGFSVSPRVALASIFPATDSLGIADQRVDVYMRTVFGVPPVFEEGAGTLLHGAVRYRLERASITLSPTPCRDIAVERTSIFRGVVSHYDQSHYMENTPLAIPFAMRAPEVPATGNASPDDAFCAVYTYEDAEGNLYRSPVSRPFGAWKVVGENTPAVTVLVADLPASTVFPGANNAVSLKAITLYAKNTNNQYGLFVTREYGSFVRNPLYPNAIAVVNGLLFSDGANRWKPGSLTDLLYTTGGILEAQIPPTMKDTCLSRGRVWGISDTRLFYTKPLAPKTGPEWNYALSVPIPEDGGIPAACVGLDDKVVVLCDKAIYVYYGNGANAAGQGASIAEPLRIPGNVGTRYYGSVAETPQGIMFLSDGGFYLLDRGLNLKFVGAQVKARTDALINEPSAPRKIRFSVLDRTNECVRFYTDWNVSYAYFMNVDQWSVLTQVNERHAVDTGNGLSVMNYVDTGASWSAYIQQETPGVAGMYLDTATYMRVRTGWISTEQIAGFQRCKDVTLSFTPGVTSGTPDTQPFNLKLYTDYAESVPDSTAVYSGAPPVTKRELFKVKPANQKCASISVEFTELDFPVGQNTPVGDKLKLLGLTLKVGAKRGTFKTLGNGWRK
jgi:hypothetical protein